MEGDKSIAYLMLERGTKLVVQKNTVLQPNFLKVGNGTMNKQKVKSIDLIDELINSSKSAQILIRDIKDGMDWDYELANYNFVVKIVKTTDAGRQALKRGYKELYRRDLVRRVKRGYYMINPHALIIDFKAQIKVWDSIPSYADTSSK